MPTRRALNDGSTTSQLTTAKRARRSPPPPVLQVPSSSSSWRPLADMPGDLVDVILHLLTVEDVNALRNALSHCAGTPAGELRDRLGALVLARLRDLNAAYKALATCNDLRCGSQYAGSLSSSSSSEEEEEAAGGGDGDNFSVVHPARRLSDELSALKSVETLIICAPDGVNGDGGACRDAVFRALQCDLPLVRTLQFSSREISLPTGLASCRQVDTIMLQGLPLSVLPEAVLRMRWLRVLDLLSMYDLKELPEDLGDRLPRLRSCVIHFTGVSRLPDSLLQVLQRNLNREPRGKELVYRGLSRLSVGSRGEMSPEYLAGVLRASHFDSLRRFSKFIRIGGP